METIIKKAVTDSPEETEALGVSLADFISEREHAFVAMYGDLGTGKTAFTRGFASRLAPSDRVFSPTFAIINEYRSGRIPVFHFDVYRITDDDDLYSTGFYEYIERGYVICEWSENIPYALPEDRIEVRILKCDAENHPDRREITVTEINRQKDIK